jgi:hypothetical protein
VVDKARLSGPHYFSMLVQPQFIFHIIRPRFREAEHG